MVSGTRNRKPTVIAMTPFPQPPNDTASLAASPYAAPDKSPTRAAFPVRTEDMEDTDVCESAST